MDAKQTNKIGTRILILRVMLILCLAGLGAKSVQVQVFHRADLTQKAERAYSRDLTIQGDRGQILDRHMNKLVTSIDAPNVTADPLHIKNPGKTAGELAPVLNISPAILKEQLAKKRRFVILAKRISRDQAQQVRDLNLKGIYLQRDSKRFYPNRELAAQVIGFTGEEAKGLEGLEYQYNEVLKGEQTRIKIRRDGEGRILDIDQTKRDELRGKAIVLTIDKKIQFLSEQALKEAVKTNRAQSGMALVMRPATGELLAVAHYPQFNPNNYKAFTRFSYRNRAVTDAFEPGSVMKVFTVAAGIEKGISPKSIFFCENGKYKIGRFTVNDTHDHGWLTLAQIIKFSSNIGAAKISETIGNRALHHYLTTFGFGSKTHLGTPVESSGILSPYQKWSNIDAGAISFGQGISVTGVQLIAALSAIANGGKLMKPMLVKRIVSNSGKTVQVFEPTVVRQVVSPKTADIVKRMMHQVVLEEGTGTRAAMDGYKVCGKTSTAQKAGRGGYLKGKYISAFGGFAPQKEPELAILVVVDEPRKSHYGGLVAAPAFKTIMSKSFNYLNIPPENTGAMIAAAPAAVKKTTPGSTGNETF